MSGLEFIKMGRLPELLNYITPDDKGQSCLTHAINSLRRQLPKIVADNDIGGELDAAIYVIGSTIVELERIHNELVDNISGYPEPDYW